MDKLDKKLVQLLGQNAQQNSEKLAKQLGVSQATIRRRVKKLTSSGVMHIVGVVDPEKAGFPLVTVIGFGVAHTHLQKAIKWLSNRREIRWVSAATGRYDIIALARFRSNEELSQFMLKELAQVEGLNKSEIFICLNIKKGSYMPPYFGLDAWQ